MLNWVTCPPYHFLFLRIAKTVFLSCFCFVVFILHNFCHCLPLQLACNSSLYTRALESLRQLLRPCGARHTTSEHDSCEMRMLNYNVKSMIRLYDFFPWGDSHRFNEIFQRFCKSNLIKNLKSLPFNFKTSKKPQSFSHKYFSNLWTIILSYFWNVWLRISIDVITKS